jgi:hypothetical protein
MSQLTDLHPRRRQFLATFLIVIGIASGLCPASRAAEPEVKSVSINDRLPYGLPPINYLDNKANDPVAQLGHRLKAGDVTLKHEGSRGYLKSLLKTLDVPIESQLLVFSKTALNQKLIGPANPRAIYFNDDIYVAWVKGAAAIEISAVDPLKGGMFYLLSQNEKKPPRFERLEQCLACHAGTTTLQVPGHMTRSFLTDARGKPLVGYSRVTHDRPLSKRWGGWYVTGTHGNQNHTGNIFGKDLIAKQKSEPSVRSNITNLKPFFDLDTHLSPHSDIVAHLVMNHQVHGHNLITRVGHEARFNRRSDAEEQLARYLLFLDEPALTAPVRGTSGFQSLFEKRGPRDSQGRSLREFDLKTRLFKHRLSYLIHTRAFDALSTAARNRVYGRLWMLLAKSGRSQAERDVIISIVRATKQRTTESLEQRKVNHGAAGKEQE